MGTYWAQIASSRILDENRVDQSGADDGNVTAWTKANDFIVAACIVNNGKDTNASQYKLMWRDVTDEGSYA